VIALSLPRMASLKWLALLSAGLFLVAPAQGRSDPRRDELKAMQAQIQSLQREIAKGEENRGEVSDQLAESERSISEAQRHLRDIADDRQAVEAEIRRLQAQQRQLEDEQQLMRKQLGETLYRTYVEGGAAGARRMLGGTDPNQMTRDAYYLQLIAQERAANIERARQALEQLQSVQQQAEARRAELLRLEKERSREQQRLVDERNKRRSVLREVAERLRAQRHDMQSLQQNQQRLEKLLQGLDRIERERQARLKAQAAQQKSSRSARSAASAAGERSGTRGEAQSGSAPSGVAETVVEEGASNASGGNFARLQGRLRWPVKGELYGRFGTPRAEAGGNWRGVFIRAAAGSEVRAVADGTVAYADWLRGFGNLLIIDHGNAYMSIYANNDSLFKTPGQRVKAGEAIASIGASGGQEESGLYFELRHQGQAIDPAKWMLGK
jgi:murein hydrolase activator